MPLQVDESQRFGPYVVTMEHEGHASIWPAAGVGQVQPTFHELQAMKDIAFGSGACAIEVFPPQRELVDGENQRHLWLVEYDAIPHMEEE